MSLLPGTRLGPYEVTSRIGVGGMGEVYRATDTRLKRDVAIKVLPDSLAADADRLARFQREAEVLASLNHTNIAILHGLEDAGGATALIMELVEGPTLADRIVHGAIPIDEALPIAKQIAEALEAAHEAGIIHRDLKPANVKVRPDGTVKVLDFGLAKAVERSVALSPGVSVSPTITTPAMTQVGMILGTAAYMSPEQAKGRTVDRRSDIWAFGVVLYEMLTGRRLFGGDDVTETLAQIVMKDPDWNGLPVGVPWRTRDVLRRCLLRDPHRRAQSIGDVRIALEEDITHPESLRPIAEAPSGVSALLSGRGAIAALAAGATLLVAAIVWILWRPTEQPRPIVRVGLDLDANTLTYDLGPAVVLSRDGSMLVFSSRATTTGRQPLRLKKLDQLTVTPLAGTEGGRDAFFSPDGRWIGFFVDGQLKKISVEGGAAVKLCDVPDARGATWTDDGSIVFNPNPGPGVSLMRVSDQGGTPEAFIPLEKGEVTQRWPYAERRVDIRMGTRHRLTRHVRSSAGSLARLDTRWEPDRIRVAACDQGALQHLLAAG